MNGKRKTKLSIDSTSIWIRTNLRIKRWVESIQWSELRKIGLSKASRWSAVWLAAIPAIARATASLPPEIEFLLSGKIITLNIDLPFSWVCLFFASLAFSAGNIIFSFRCPPFIRLYGDYEEFTRKTGGSASVLVFWNRKQIEEVNPRSLFDSEDEWQTEINTLSSQVEQENNLVDDEMLSPAEQTGVRAPMLTNAFIVVEDDAERLRPLSKAACQSFYLIGFILLSYTGLTAVKWMVWDYLLGW